MDTKKVDKWSMVISGILLVIGLFIIYILSKSLGTLSQNQQLLLLLSVVFISVSLGYLITSVIMIIFQSIFKKLSNHFKVNIYLKVFVGVIISILILGLIRNYTNYDNFNYPKEIVVSKILPGAIKNQNQEFCSNIIVFQKGNFRLSSETIIKNTKLTPNQVIFINPYDINRFVINENVLSNRDLSKSHIICGICDTGKTKLQSTLLINNITTLIDSNIEDKTLCVIYPKY